MGATMFDMKRIFDFIYSVGMIKMENEDGEIRKVFPNGYKANVIEYPYGISIACMDHNGYLNCDLPEKNNCYFCHTELQALAVIERISKIGEW